MKLGSLLLVAAFALLAPLPAPGADQPWEPSAPPTVSTSLTPLGFTANLPRLVLPPERPRAAAIQVRAQPLSAPVGESVSVVAEVLDQFGQPMRDGTPVQFFAGAGRLVLPSIVPLKGGQAATTLTTGTETVASLTAMCGFVQAACVVWFRGPRAPAASEAVVFDDLTLTAGSGTIRGGKAVSRVGVRLAPDDKGRQGIVYRLPPTPEGSLVACASGLSNPAGAEGLFHLVGEGQPGAVFELRRAPKGPKTVWSLRASVRGEEAKARAERSSEALKALDPAVSYEFTLTWSPGAFRAVCRPAAGGAEVFSLALDAKSLGPVAVDRAIVGGHAGMAGPSGITVTKVVVTR